jgi:hypothetical protein
MAIRSRSSGCPYGESVSLSELGLSDAELEAEAVAAARAGVRSLERLGLAPTDELRRQATGDPDLVAEFVARHQRRTSPDNAVA